MIVENLTKQVRTYLSTLSAADAEDNVLVKERDIAKKFDTNHGNARRVLITLESEGLLRCIPRRGYQLVDYSRTEVQSMFRVRVAIEAEAARQAAKHADREDILRMMLILEEADPGLHNEHFARSDADFHQALVNASKDNLLIRLFEFMLVLGSAQAPEKRTREYREAVTADHRRILDAIRRRDYLAADQAVVLHLGPILKEREAYDLKLKKEALDDKGMLVAWRQRGGKDEDPATDLADESAQ